MHLRIRILLGSQEIHNLHRFPQVVFVLSIFWEPLPQMFFLIKKNKKKKRKKKEKEATEKYIVFFLFKEIIKTDSTEQVFQHSGIS